MICPYCCKEIEPIKEDNSFSYDIPFGNGTAVHEDVCYVCPECEECLENYEYHPFGDENNPENWEER
jgi:hypothetical protein